MLPTVLAMQDTHLRMVCVYHVALALLNLPVETGFVMNVPLALMAHAVARFLQLTASNVLSGHMEQMEEHLL